MGYNELEVELRKVLAQIARWRDSGRMPAIEQGLALGRLQDIYAGLLDLPGGEEALPETSDTAVEAETGGWDDGEASDDESFESCCDDSERDESGDDDGNFADLSVEEGSRVSGETHLMQEYGSRDLCPPVTEVPDEQPEETDVETPAAAEEAKPEQPKIFGIEVGPYTRHEIVDTLFHGNVELFDAECSKLDAMESLDEALVYIGETYHWIPDNAATVKFVDLLESRFGEASN